MGLGLGAHIGIGIGDGEEFHALTGVAQGLVFGGMVMAEHTGADNGSLQRSIFGHAATQEQDLGTLNAKEAPIRNRARPRRQQRNVAACYHVSV